ncbi:hypothetical protein F750_1048 [Streptomyces sp. PAMC 26508]|nr:hypothetical protein F750_1048 [Streptomyces sp. PAMC 26508]
MRQRPAKGPNTSFRALLAAAGASEYDPADTRTTWEDTRWAG